MDCMNYNRMDGLRLCIALSAVGSIEDHPRFKRLAEIEEAALHPCRHKKKVARFEGDDFFAHLKATPNRQSPRSIHRGCAASGDPQHEGCGARLAVGRGFCRHGSVRDPGRGDAGPHRVACQSKSLHAVNHRTLLMVHVKPLNAPTATEADAPGKTSMLFIWPCRGRPPNASDF